MSLLIDALKQAEAARAQIQGGEAPDVDKGIELEPMEKPPSPQPMTSTARQPLEHGGFAEAAPRRSRPSSPPHPAANNAARELFEVKQRTPNRLPLILAGTGVVLLLIGAGYVWWATQPRSSLIAPGINNVSQPTPMAVVSAPVSPSPEANPISSATSAVPSAATVGSDHQAAPALPSSALPYRREKRESSSARVQQLPERAPVDTRGARIAETLPAAETNGIQSAYAAFQEGNYNLARQRYQDVWRQDPRNVDAMNALGLIAWRSGQLDLADRMFRAAVRADPKDATAISQLALLYSEGDPGAAEAKLRSLIASQPSAGAAYYALGGLLSRQGRWNEAQQALFQAYTLDSDNPDVLFNLAVSLEHLAQPSVAAQFYERALQAAVRRPAGFDKSVAQGRVLALGSR